ncbi:MAG: enoyl-CoA hydratase/isomerase family protein [Pseudomonadales bacterium]
MSNDDTLYAVANGVATITLNKEENKNALSVDLVNSLGDNLNRALDDEKVRAIVLSNNGNTFCAGADLKGDPTATPRYPLPTLFELMQSANKPVVGRIAGHCMGGGVGLAAACDISIAADDIKLGFTEVRIGVAPAIISVVCLPKMRYGDAMELFLSGERISSSHASELGLLNHAVPRDELDTRLDELMAKLVRGGPLAMAAAKQLVLKVPDMDRSAAFEWTAKVSADLFKSEEASHGIKSFRDRVDAPWVPSSE